MAFLLCFTGLVHAEWRNLVDPELSAWRIWLGVPHRSHPVPGYEARENVKERGAPMIGYHRTLRDIVTVREEAGVPVIRVSGEIFGSLETKEEFSNYHLTLQFKWGEKKWAPRLEKRRNSGILYHSVPVGDRFWNAWLTSLECEIMEKDCGDFISIGPVRATCPAVEVKPGRFEFSPKGKDQMFAWMKPDYVTGRCFKPGDPEKPHGEWNTMELYCVGNENVHLLNGKVVMVVKNPSYLEGEKWIPMDRGKIQLQSEAAELFFKDIRIRSLKKISGEIRKRAGLVSMGND